MKNCLVITGTAALACLAGTAFGQVTVNGRLDASETALYGAPKWIQSNPTQFGDAGPSNPCDPLDAGGNPLAVTTGVEFKIPLSRIGGSASGIRLMAFVNGQGHDYASNQFLPPLPNATGNLGGDGLGNFNGGVTGINLNNFAGDQFVTITPASGTPAVDGTLDTAYGAAVAVQNQRTGFGNSNAGNQFANGSELDAMYVLADASFLYVFIAGNMQTNFNKLELFIDSAAGVGQNVMLAGNPGVDFNALDKFIGFTFDTGFDADYYLTFGAGGNGGIAGGPQFYPNFADLLTITGQFEGCSTVGDGNGVLDECGAPPADGLEISINNANVDGVAGGCPPPAGNADVASGSEMNGLYAYVDTVNRRLNILVTGNLENSLSSPCDQGGNKVMLFVDADGSGAGQNVLLGNNLNVDIAYGALNRMGGFTFDAGVSPDYFLSFKTQGGPTNASQVIDAAVLRTNGKILDNVSGLPLDFGAYDGNNKALGTPINFSGDFSQCNGNFTDFIQQQDGFTANLFANYGPREAQADSGPVSPTLPVGTDGLILGYIDNSNIAGVTSTTVSGASAVSTGIELSVDLSELGWDGQSCIKIAGFITNAAGDFLSNQVIGSLPCPYGTRNLGSDGTGSYVANTVTVNLGSIFGNQYITVNCAQPTPPARCVADVDDGSNLGNPDGGVGIEDLLFYLSTYDSGTLCADVDDGSSTGTQDGGVGIEDLLYYLARYDAGC